MQLKKYTQNALIGAAAVALAGSQVLPNHGKSGPIWTTVSTALAATPSRDSVPATAASASTAARSVVANVDAALDAFRGIVRPLSNPVALSDAFRSYFAFKAAHPDEVTKPYLYFVDYGLPSTETRGYVFDMESLKIVDGPFTVAHGAPYVTPDKAGRSEGCPAMEPDRAQRLLPKLADGAMVFLFAPDANWLANDPWVGAASN